MANFLTTLTGSMRQRLIHEADPVDPAGAVDAYLPQVGATLVSAAGVPLATLPIADTWEQAIISDVTDDDSDKTLAVPAATEWQPLALHITLATTADVGDRQLAVVFQDADGNVLAQVRPNVTQAESLTRYYSIALGQPDDAAFYDTDLVRTPMPIVALAATDEIRVYDNNAVAAAADDMHIHLTVMAR